MQRKVPICRLNSSRDSHFEVPVHVFAYVQVGMLVCHIYVDVNWELTIYLVDPASGICLSQRLSHACLSMRNKKHETANGSVKQQ